LDTYVTLSIEETNGDEYVIDKKEQQWNFGYLSHTFHQNGRKRKREEYSQWYSPERLWRPCGKKKKRKEQKRHIHPYRKEKKN
jgi:hypothetical protein